MAYAHTHICILCNCMCQFEHSVVQKGADGACVVGGPEARHSSTGAANAFFEAHTLTHTHTFISSVACGRTSGCVCVCVADHLNKIRTICSVSLLNDIICKTISIIPPEGCAPRAPKHGQVGRVPQMGCSRRPLHEGTFHRRARKLGGSAGQHVWNGSRKSYFSECRGDATRGRLNCWSLQVRRHTEICVPGACH